MKDIFLVWEYLLIFDLSRGTNQIQPLCVCICVFVHLSVCLYLCVHTAGWCRCGRTSIFVDMDVCSYVCMCVCLYIYVHVYVCVYLDTNTITNDELYV